MITKYTAKELKERVTIDLGLILFEDIYSLLGITKEQGCYNFKLLIEKSIREYCEYHAAVLELKLPTNNEYTFIDNFDQYLSGEITEDEIQLIPIGISRIGKTYFVSASYWQYRLPKLIPRYPSGGTWSNAICVYFAAHPVRLTIGPDGDFTEDSAVYILDTVRNDDFLYFLNLNVGNSIRRVSNSVDMPLQVNYMASLDQAISDYQTKVDDVKMTAATVMDIWRK